MLADDVRECPATWALAASWALIFALMHLVQWREGIAIPAGGFANPLAVTAQIGHRFGDMTWAEVCRGEGWRLVTATFVHFSLLHVGMNVFGLIKLGQLIEPWYGAGPFLAICLAIGGLGNLVGGLIRQGIALGRVALSGTRVAQAWPAWFAAGGPDGAEVSFLIPSGGGSTILLGLLGLGAVVGWRSKTRIGSFLRDQMVTMLAFTAVLGILLINLIDNYGHAGGAIVGAGFGFVHRPLLRLGERSRGFRRACWAFAATLSLACLGAAVRDDRAEVGYRAEVARTNSRLQLDQGTLHDLEQVSVLYARALGLIIEAHNPYGELDLLGLDPLLKGLAVAPLPSTPQPLTPDQWLFRTRIELGIALRSLAARPAATWGEPTARDLAEVDAYARALLDGPPPYHQAYAFVVAWRAAARVVGRDRDEAEAHDRQLERQLR